MHDITNIEPIDIRHLFAGQERRQGRWEEGRKEKEKNDWINFIICQYPLFH